MPAPTPVPEPVTVDQDPVQQEIVTPVEEVQTEKEEQQQEPEAPETKENEEIVPGFGIAIKLIEQTNNNTYQQPIEDYIGQLEDDYAAEQNLLFNFIQSDDIGDRFDGIARYRWDQLHGDNPLQRYGFGD
jgi:hypothetical protein